MIVCVSQRRAVKFGILACFQISALSAAALAGEYFVFRHFVLKNIGILFLKQNMAALLHVLSKALFRVKPHNLANSLDLSP